MTVIESNKQCQNVCKRTLFERFFYVFQPCTQIDSFLPFNLFLNINFLKNKTEFYSSYF